MTAPFMRAYTELLVKTCHKRGAFAMGGMAAFIPSRKDAEVNAVAFAKVSADKTREAGDGFDGSWVAHPDLVPVCREVFDGVLGDQPNQLDRQRRRGRGHRRPSCSTSPRPRAATPRRGCANNLEVAVAYTAVWLSGNGAVGIHNLMEDAATAEISRSQVWQQIQQRGRARRHRRDGDRGAGRPDPRRGGRASCASRSTGRAVREATTCRPSELIADLVPVRRLHRLPDPARVRAGQVSVLTAPADRAWTSDVLADLDARLADTDAFLARAYPGEDGRRQPVHTVYVPADRYTADLPQRWGAEAVALVAEHGGLDGAVPTLGAGRRPAPRRSPTGRGQAGRRADRGPPARLRGRLRRPRPTRSRTPTRSRSRSGSPTPWPPAPPRPSSGLRFKCFEAPTRRRGLRTLDLFLSTLLERPGELPGRPGDHLPEGQHGQPGRGHGRRLRGVRDAPPGCPPGGSASRSRWRPRS